MPVGIRALVAVYSAGDLQAALAGRASRRNRILYAAMMLSASEAMRRFGRWAMKAPAIYSGVSRVVRPLVGNRIRSGPAKGLWFYGGDTVGYQLGISEPLVQRALVRHLEPGAVFYDIGAHAGFMAVLAARLVGPTGAVVAFDPIGENLALSSHNIRANDGLVRCDFRPMEVALSDRDGTEMMDVPVKAITASISTAGAREVSAARLDSLADLRPPSLIKIDVEGAEIQVLEGARQTLSQHRPVVIVEIHGDRESQVREILHDAGYVTIERLADGGMPHLLAT